MTDESRVSANRYGVVSDHPRSNDLLGMGEYIDSVESYLVNDAEPPLTIAIDGEWGEGKSTFMQIVQSRMTENETVWFNPWYYRNEEDLWTAFMLEFFSQLYPNRWTMQGMQSYAKLLWRRIDWNEVQRGLIKSWVIGTILLSLALVLFASLFLGIFTLPDTSTDLSELQNLTPVGSIASLSAVVSFLWVLGGNVHKQLKSPLSESFDTYLSDPSYSNRIIFIEEIHREFNTIVEVFGAQDPVYVFIDDLDRGELWRSVELIESINGLLNENSNVIFILGLDVDTLAAAVEAKHNEFLTRVPGENVSTPGKGYGRQYLSKFVQISFPLPKPTSKDLLNFYDGLVGFDSPSAEATASMNGKNDCQQIQYPFIQGSENEHDEQVEDQEQVEEAVSRYVNDYYPWIVRDVLRCVLPALGHNPRQVIRFLNSFRLQTTLARNLGYFDWVGNPNTNLPTVTLQQLGKFVAITMRWPALLADLRVNEDLLNQLYDETLSQTLVLSEESVFESEAATWKTHLSLIRVLQEGPEGEYVDYFSENEYSLETLDVAPLVTLASASRKTLAHSIAQRLSPTLSKLSAGLKRARAEKESRGEITPKNRRTIASNTRKGATDLSKIVNTLSETQLDELDDFRYITHSTLDLLNLLNDTFTQIQTSSSQDGADSWGETVDGLDWDSDELTLLIQMVDSIRAVMINENYANHVDLGSDVFQSNRWQLNRVL